MKTKMITATMLIVIFITAASFGFQTKPWAVPDKNSKMANPVKADAASVKAGKSLWDKNCQSCHGKTGKGDGSKAAGLKTHPGDFSGADMQGQTDGALFYKVAEGRDEMPSFKKKLPDEEDIWNLVNYMRSLKK
jgi:mono/diheme cytochrome c family protein